MANALTNTWLDAQIRRARAAMHEGQTLQLAYCGGAPQWSLSAGERVTPEVAEILICDAAVSPNNDALFPDALEQTWRVK